MKQRKNAILSGLLLFLSLTLASCSSAKKEAETAQNNLSTENMKQEVQKAEAASAAKHTSDATASESEPTPTLTTHKKDKEPHDLPKLTGVEPLKALGWLKNGNTRFSKNRLRNDGQSKADVQRLAAGQSPHTVVVSCSDSRVPPELVFDQKLGEIFVVRTAGQSLDDTSLGSIEYAVEHLGARLILVLGHTSCGAIKASLAMIKKNQPLGSPYIEAIAKDIEPRIAKVASQHEPEADVKDEVHANASGVAKDLLARSHILNQYYQSGQLMVQSAVYNLKTGLVEFQ